MPAGPGSRFRRLECRAALGYKIPPSSQCCLPLYAPTHSSLPHLDNMRLPTLFIFVSLAIAASAGPVLELRGGRPNGVSCRHDAACYSNYCHHSKCDVKKAEGHVCYKDAGCESGLCGESCSLRATPEVRSDTRVLRQWQVPQPAS